ncbi:uncharacterized protein [Typha angustifolia]|uniref:uncharacterized protein n=1 Tax=Typha angustifolia TaxID=59011 RepID=UPI003C2D085C
MEWNFIGDSLKLFDFLEEFIRLIMACISTTTLAIEVNGKAEGYFNPSRGIRQKCHLSPYPFIIGSNVRSLLENDMKLNRIRGIRITRIAPPISHLMFTNDLLLFGVANEKETTNIKASLNLYCTWSGQAINFEKLAIQFSSKTRADLKNIVLHKLMVKTLDKHDRYLGNPLLLPKSTAEAFSAIPIYFMASNILPKSLLDKMKGIMRDFLWGFENGRKNIYLRSWDQICKPTNFGQLGIKRLDAVNQALIAKLAWRKLVKPNILWANTLKAKYFRNSSFWNAARKQSKSGFGAPSCKSGTGYNKKPVG